ncbi:MAG: hypothetical protein AAGC99_03260 [Pseudomonadota bacterium]
MNGRTEPELGPWNPGLSSKLPSAALSLSTVYRSENIVGCLDQALERSAFTGLEPENLVAFRPERLVVHELLIRVTGDFSVPDGKRYADLGINFRNIVDTILKRDILLKMADIIESYEALRRGLKDEIARELAHLKTVASPPPIKRPTPHPLLRWLGFEKEAAVSSATGTESRDIESGVLAEWRREGRESVKPRRRRVCRALADVAEALSIKHGRLPSDTQAIADIALDRALNDHGSAVIGGMIEPLIAEAVAREGYRLLPAQAEPVIMNVKGASAAGKSTLRPLQRRLAERLGIDWADFGLISPDIWRKYLLDYDSLGEFSRYAGTLTGHELRIIDQKLDRYMAEKAKLGAMSHLLIDRFRFDSFAETEGGEQGARLLTRFGSTIYMFFVITPPEATVERAWGRGLQFGRFKAVDDLLHHNVEAFTGMPDLFFTWALRKDKNVHYEFLDNSVPLGERPRTVAFGWNGDMTILDIKSFLNVDRYRRIDINARSPEQVYPDVDCMAPTCNTDFLKRCVKEITCIQVADQESGRILARIENGKPCWIDPEALDQVPFHPDIEAGMAILVPDELRAQAEFGKETAFLDFGEAPTLGAFGPHRKD